MLILKKQYLTKELIMAAIKIGLGLLCLKHLHDQHKKAHKGHSCPWKRHRHNHSDKPQPSIPPVTPPQPPAVTPGKEVSPSKPAVKPVHLSKEAVLIASLVIGFIALAGISLAVAHLMSKVQIEGIDEQKSYAYHSAIDSSHMQQAVIPPKLSLEARLQSIAGEVEVKELEELLEEDPKVKGTLEFDLVETSQDDLIRSAMGAYSKEALEFDDEELDFRYYYRNLDGSYELV